MSIAEGAQWAAIVLLAVAVLVLFALHGARGSTARHDDHESLIGPDLGSRVVLEGQAERERLLAFVTEHCTGCMRLLASIEARRNVGGTVPDTVLVTRRPSETFRERLTELGLPVIVDDGQIWQELRISATPYLVLVDSNGIVTRKGIHHDADEFLDGYVGHPQSAL